MLSMQSYVLQPNDRICIGPSAMFLFKNKAQEANASMPDTDDDPISYDFAAEEVSAIENKEVLDAQQATQKAMAEESKKKMDAMEA